MDGKRFCQIQGGGGDRYEIGIIYSSASEGGGAPTVNVY